jgi:hypothetical protein
MIYRLFENGLQISQESLNKQTRPSISFIAVWAMPASTFAAVTSFQMILLSEYDKTFLREVIILFR